MNRLLEALINLLFPPKCPFCGRILEGVGICPECEKTLPWIPEEQVVMTERGLSCAAPLWYEGTVREAMLRLKFRNTPGLAEPLGELLARCAAERFGGEFDTVTWVPVSRKRLRKRGYDQSRLLAEAACRHWDTAPAELLQKTRDNPAQSSLSSREERQKNVSGVYAAVNEEKIKGARILLIDDILTTGATLREAARVLRAAGAESVICATLASADED